MSAGGDQEDVARAIGLDEVVKAEPALEAHLLGETALGHGPLARRAFGTVADDPQRRADAAVANGREGPHRQQRILLWMELRDEQEGQRRPGPRVGRRERALIDAGADHGRIAAVGLAYGASGLVAQYEDLARDARGRPSEPFTDAPDNRVEDPDPSDVVRRQAGRYLVAGPHHGPPKQWAGDRRRDRCGEIVRIQDVGATPCPQHQPQENEWTEQEREGAG